MYSRRCAGVSCLTFRPALWRDNLDEKPAQVSALIRTFGHAQTEIWTGTEWDRFKEIVRSLPVST